MSGRSFGYARVSTDDQNLTLQIDALTNHGIPAAQIFRDKLSVANFLITATLAMLAPRLRLMRLNHSRSRASFCSAF